MSRRPYQPAVSRYSWFMRQPRYKAYMLRELTCVLVAFYCVLMLIGLQALASGDEQRWDGFLAGQQQPGWIAFHAAALVFFIVYQTMAWFRLAPKAMPLQLGNTEVPPAAIVTAHYIGWVVVSILVLWFSGAF